MRFVSSDSIVLFMYFANLKSGLGSCIAPKAGLARHPAKGMFRAGMFSTFWIAVAPDQGVVMVMVMVKKVPFGASALARSMIPKQFTFL